MRMTPGRLSRVLPLDDEGRAMRTYFFDVTVKVLHEGDPMKTVLYRGARAQDELAARRIVLNQLLEGGFQVVRLDRVRECGLPGGEDWAA
jgi:hypothetical protein